MAKLFLLLGFTVNIYRLFCRHLTGLLVSYLTVKHIGSTGYVGFTQPPDVRAVSRNIGEL